MCEGSDRYASQSAMDPEMQRLAEANKSVILYMCSGWAALSQEEKDESTQAVIAELSRKQRGAAKAPR
ncbi:MAG: hypothetical protein JRN62_03095 [Nitrososphaerota archaeon]|jgi:hypothetical protein|nr:hypothetical protein [Nitrososphaerota archaeon]MDG6948980.1 hypothetical protein [Nitrososphaerota archaeon]